MARERRRRAVSLVHSMGFAAAGAFVVRASAQAEIQERKGNNLEKPMATDSSKGQRKNGRKIK
jgi:hypothetical protein